MIKKNYQEKVSDDDHIKNILELQKKTQETLGQGNGATQTQATNKIITVSVARKSFAKVFCLILKNIKCISFLNVNYPK